MNYYFNELCLKTSSLQVDPSALMNDFLLVCAVMRLSLKANLCVEEDFHTALMEFTLRDGYRVRDWVSDKGVDRELRDRFRATLNADIKPPMIGDSQLSVLGILESSIYALPADTREFETGRSGIGAAMQLGSLVVSLRSHPFWEASELKVVQKQLTDLAEWIEEFANVPHASKVDHFVSHRVRLEAIAGREIFDDHNFAIDHFPNLAATRVWEDCSDHLAFLGRCRSMDPDTRRAAYLGIAKRVAEINGYVQCEPEVRNLNRDDQGRSHMVYRAGRDRKRIYISVDAKTGEFEVFDFSGRQIAIHQLNGELSSKTPPGHVLRLPY